MTHTNDMREELPLDQKIGMILSLLRSSGELATGYKVEHALKAIMGLITTATREAKREEDCEFTDAPETIPRAVKEEIVKQLFELSLSAAGVTIASTETVARFVENYAHAFAIEQLEKVLRTAHGGGSWRRIIEQIIGSLHQ